MKSKREDRGYPGYESWPHPKPSLPVDEDEDEESES